MSSYKGESIGKTPSGVDVRKLTPEEAASHGMMRYLLDGYSHWNPPEFFSRHAAELERLARLHREAAYIIANRAEGEPEEPSGQWVCAGCGRTYEKAAPFGNCGVCGYASLDWLPRSAVRPSPTKVSGTDE